MTLAITLDDPAKFLRNVLSDLPEYSEGFTLSCYGVTKLAGDGRKYMFIDGVTQEDHELTPEIAMRGLEIFAALVASGEYAKLTVERFPDPNWWDSYDLDAMIQFAFFGRIIYVR